MRETPTVYEVAARAGVSTATVSRVLSGRDRVLAPTRDKVLAAVAELGYVPSGAAKDLAARKTGVLGLCFPDLVGDTDIAQGDATYWYDEVIRGMERAARRSGYAVLIAASHESDDVNLVLTVAGRSDGLVVLAHTVPVGMLEHVATRIPVVLLAAQPGAESGMGETGHVLDHLSVANENGAYEVTAHLADQHGYQRIGFVAGPPDSPDSSRRFDGYRKAMAERGLPVPGRPRHHGDFTTAGGRRVAAEILAGPTPGPGPGPRSESELGPGPVPQALVCANDQTAIGVMKALQRTGLRVPEDVAITGFDGIQLGEHLRPSLTTVLQPMRELGETAVRLLKERMADPGLPSRSVELAVRLQPRASCGCPEPTGPEPADGAGPGHRAAIKGPSPTAYGERR
jgi:LacI family transcriptional regulator